MVIVHVHVLLQLLVLQIERNVFGFSHNDGAAVVVALLYSVQGQGKERVEVLSRVLWREWWGRQGRETTILGVE